MKTILILLTLLLVSCAPVLGYNRTFKDVYSYKIDEGFDIELIHARVLETGIRDIAIGTDLHSIITNQGATVQPLLDEIKWVKKKAHAKTIWVIDYNESTRMGYEPDGVYRYYRKWEYRLDAYRAIAKEIDYFIVVVGVMHYPAPSDITTYLLALNGIFREEDVKFGVYDGDGVRDNLNYELLAEEGIFIWSDIYIDSFSQSAYLRSPNGWGNLVTLFYMGPGSWQFNEPEDFQLGYDLMRENDFTGYNIILTWLYEGVMPDYYE
ncbi:hypothetical protein LCGC14_0431260 [marine sediment metagenome]|uniref:Uncharacterized protein n=1 Tax=marine sediment metagenome TaxID=412755 RepID=A0A0F9VA62_9ZZZZ